jgi:UDP-glucose 4-epimerase
VITIFGLAQTAVRVLNSNSQIRFVQKNYADVELRVPSVDKARKMIGFEATVDLDEGIQLTAESFARKPVAIEPTEALLAETSNV